MPLVLFPSEPFADRRTDPAFAEERRAAQATGLPTDLYDHEALVAGDVRAAAAGLAGPGACLLRGWMVPGEAYAALHAELVRRGLEPVVSPDAYEEAHYLPLAYPHLAAHTAPTEWITGDDPDAAWALYARAFRSADALIKDWVKSAKHRWREACFLPAGTDEARFRQIFAAFREERGALFNRGVVLRRALPLATRGTDAHGMPISAEARLFFWRGALLVEPRDVPHLERWGAIARRFRSPFLTLDVAPLASGEWVVIEAGDGGVSGLPPDLDPERFYAALGQSAQ